MYNLIHSVNALLWQALSFVFMVVSSDLRASLELAIVKVYNLAVQANTPPDSDYTSDCDEDSPSVPCNQALTSAVRKDLASAIADLLQHGLMHVSLRYLN